MEQRTTEWYNQRLYKFTSSQVYKLMTEPKSKAAKEAGELSQTAQTYILERITEELGGNIPDFSSRATEWGHEQEPKAKRWYEVITGNTVEDVGFLEVNEFYGGSPDGMVRELVEDETGEWMDHGGLEIKNPYNSRVHLEHCLIDSPEYFKDAHPDHYWQCTSHMITLSVNWCDFVSFDERINCDLGFFRFRLHKNEEDAQLLLKKLEAANKYKKELKIKLGLEPHTVLVQYDNEAKAMVIE